MLDYRYRQYREKKSPHNSFECVSKLRKPVAHIRRSVGFRSGRRAGQTRRHRRIIINDQGDWSVQHWYRFIISIQIGDTLCILSVDEQMYGKLYSSVLVWDYTQKAYFATIISSYHWFPIVNGFFLCFQFYCFIII